MEPTGVWARTWSTTPKDCASTGDMKLSRSKAFSKNEKEMIIFCSGIDITSQARFPLAYIEFYSSE